MAATRRRFARWLLIDGNRHAVAALFLLGAFAALVALGAAGYVTLGDQAAVRAVGGGFIPGLIAFLSIVLAINQLVLSQEFGSAGEIRDRIEAVREYRHDAEAIAGEGPSPVLPTGFLAFIVATIEQEATQLEGTLDEGMDPDLQAAVQEYARDVADEATAARESLSRVRPGRINALLPVLEYDDSGQLLGARRLQDRGEELPAETRQSLDRLAEVFELFSVARTQFRSTYTQRVLSRLSRQLLYVGLPALVVVVVLGLLPAPPDPADPSLARISLVSALFTVALAPLAVLAAYLLRVAAVSERTISVGPFVSRPSAGSDAADGRDRHS